MTTLMSEPSMLDGTRWDSGTDETRDCCRCLGDLLLSLLTADPDRVSHTVSEMLVEQRQCHRLQSLGCGRDLREDVNAIGIVFDHPLETTHLAFDTPEAVQVRLLVAYIAGFICHICTPSRAQAGHVSGLRGEYPHRV